MSSLKSFTKAELINLLTAAQAQRAADIIELSARETTILALRNRVEFFEAEMVMPRVILPSDDNNEHLDPTNVEEIEATLPVEPPKARGLNIHDYADYAEARDNCKRLAMSALNEHYSFTQRGVRVIAKMRIA